MGWVRRLLSQWQPPSRGGVPPQRLTLGPVKTNQTNPGFAEKLNPPLRGGCQAYPAVSATHIQENGSRRSSVF